MEIGDWVQAADEIVELDLPEVGDRWVHAKSGGIGHVIGDSVHAPGELWIVYWERTGSISDCHLGQINRLGGAETGKAQAPTSEPPAEVIGKVVYDSLDASTPEEFHKSVRRWNVERWAELYGLPGLADLASRR